MTSTPCSAVEAPSGAVQTPLSPVPVPGRIRYGLVNSQGLYFVHAHRAPDGTWTEWNDEPFDAHEWVSLDACAAAAREFAATTGEPLLVVLL